LNFEKQNAATQAIKDIIISHLQPTLLIINFWFNKAKNQENVYWIQILFIFASIKKQNLKIKKTMKKIKNVLAVMIMAFGLMITAQSCKDPCKDVECNFGTCDEGTCLCEDGYEGTNCDVELRNKFLATYRVSGTDTDGDSYTDIPVKIEAASANVKAVLITWDNEVVMNGNSSASNTITIPSQTAGGSTLSGTITGGGSTITMVITAGTGADAYTITATGSRQ
jgi:hypothetical protein